MKKNASPTETHGLADTKQPVELKFLTLRSFQGKSIINIQLCGNYNIKWTVLNCSAIIIAEGQKRGG